MHDEIQVELLEDNERRINRRYTGKHTHLSTEIMHTKQSQH